jgi:2-polyprenylphenol hydroxylase and related flavodoxin oxidoreductases
MGSRCRRDTNVNFSHWQRKSIHCQELWPNICGNSGTQSRRQDIFQGTVWKAISDRQRANSINWRGIRYGISSPSYKQQSFGLVAARSKEEILFADEFTDENLIITTDDGSEGIKGNVIEGLKKIDLKKFDMIYACGPEVMLYNAYLYFREIGVNAQLSLERTMKCG